MAQSLNMLMLFMVLMVSSPPFAIDLSRGSTPLHALYRQIDTRLSKIYIANYSDLAFSISSGYNALVDGSCTSCEVTQDKSAYWTPAPYFQSSTGEFTLVQQVGGMLAYVTSPPFPASPFDAFLVNVLVTCSGAISLFSCCL